MDPERPSASKPTKTDGRRLIGSTLRCQWCLHDDDADHLCRFDRTSPFRCPRSREHGIDGCDDVSGHGAGRRAYHGRPAHVHLDHLFYPVGHSFFHPGRQPDEHRRHHRADLPVCPVTGRAYLGRAGSGQCDCQHDFFGDVRCCRGGCCRAGHDRNESHERPWI